MCLIAYVGSLFQPPGPKRRFLGPNPFQMGPFLVGSCFDRNIGMWGVQIVATEFSDGFRQLQLILNHPAGETVQNVILGPFRGQKCPFGVPGGPEEAPYQAKVCGNHNTSPVRPVGGSLDQIWSPGALRGPLGPPIGALRAKMGPFRVPGGPEEARYQAKVCANHNSSQVRPIGDSWDQSRPLWCAQKLFSQLGSV